MWTGHHQGGGQDTIRGLDRQFPEDHDRALVLHTGGCDPISEASDIALKEASDSGSKEASDSASTAGGQGSNDADEDDEDDEDEEDDNDAVGDLTEVSITAWEPNPPDGVLSTPLMVSCPPP